MVDICGFRANNSSRIQRKPIGILLIFTSLVSQSGLTFCAHYTKHKIMEASFITPNGLPYLDEFANSILSHSTL